MANLVRKAYNVYRGDDVMHKYHVLIHPAEEGGYWAEAPQLPGCLTQGETIDEIVDNAYEAAELMLEDERDVAEFNLTFEVVHA